jgi:hypothetical protein
MATSSNVSDVSDVSDIKDALNEYFKLKLKYEDKIMENKKKIMNNTTLSNREKRVEYLKLKPKCVNCGRPGGTKFQNIYFSADDKEESHRQYSATCGVIADPCNLQIKINVGNVELLPNILDDLQNNIKTNKNEVIDDKNKLLFGYLSTEEVLTKFDDLKEEINSYTLLYEQYLEKYNELVDNDQKKNELEESTTESFYKIDEIKKCIQEMNEKNNAQYARDAVSIYTTTLQPLLNKIRMLKYNENMVWHNPDTNTCHLIQNKYSIQNLSYASYTDKIISNEQGPQLKIGNKDKKSKKLIIDEKPSDEEIEQTNERDDITWPNQAYANLWNEMPTVVKNELKKDPEWMKETVKNCIIARKNNQPYTIKPPKNLKVPPEVMPNGEYNFGSKIYSDMFNGMDQPTRLYFGLDDGTYDWNKYIDHMNNNYLRSVGTKYINNKFVIPGG